MIIVKKDNRVLHIDELEEQAYLEDGYDVVAVVDGEYVVAKPSTGGRTYSTAEYRAVQAERDALKAELEQVKAELATVKANLTVANARNGEPLV